MKPHEIENELAERLTGIAYDYWQGLGDEGRNELIIEAQNAGLDAAEREAWLLALRDPSEAESLDDLCEILNEYRESPIDLDEAGIDTTSLPTFGGQDIDEISVFSWDATRQLVQAEDGWEVVPRTDEPFAMLLIAALEQANMTRTQLAERTGISLQQISDYCTGRRDNPSYRVMQALAEGLGISVAELLGGTS